MPLIEWSENLSVQVREFDLQHQRLVGLINGLYDAMKQGKGKEVLAQIFSELVEYTQVHFTAEEKLMALYQYPGLSAHRSEHENLTRQALELRDKFNAGNLFVTVDTLNFLREWLSKHILETDKQYGPFLNSKNVM